MEAFYAGLLGLVQGLTEFLPISSSGHLVIFQHFLGFSEPEVFFDICLHVGTLVAVCVVFHQPIFTILAAMCRLPATFASKDRFKKTVRDDEAVRTAWLILVGSVPTALLGLLLKPAIGAIFGTIWVTGLMLLVTATLLWLTRRTPVCGRSVRQMTVTDALIIGLVQGLAILPGISRSGATISAALFLGIDRQIAGRFSFLLSIPAILGALLLSLEADIFQTRMSPGAVLLGTIIAAGTGYVALKWLLRVVSRGKLHLFSPYCLCISGIVLMWCLL